MIIVPDGSFCSTADETIRVEVQKVFDGDGFLARAWHPHRCGWIERVPFRLAFVDAPEMDQPFGRESREFLHKLVTGRTLNLIPVLKGTTTPSFIDPYRRFLCVPLFTELMEAGRIDYWDGQYASGSLGVARRVIRNLELEMIVNGWAWVLERYTFDREAEYLAAQSDARENRRGLWVQDNPEPPWNFKRRQKRMTQKSVGHSRLI